MKKLFILVAVISMISGCSIRQGFKKDAALLQEMSGNAVVAERAALRFFKRGGFAKSVELFKDAAVIYGKVGDKTGEKRALVAAAKTQLWAGNRGGFLETMDAIRDLVGKYEYPEDDTLTLLNISDRMEGRPLSYPPLAGQEALFSN